MILGFLGPRGSYSYEAACSYAKQAVEPVKCIALPDFTAIINGVEQETIDSGVLPVENSTHGAVAAAMDMLLKLRKGSVCGEVILDIKHCLLSVGGNIRDIRYVYSHEQALEQCRQYFTDNYPHIEFITCASTSQACELARANGPVYGAVASKTAAQIYGLGVAAENIQDNTFNQTRFFIIGRKPPLRTGQDKTSIVFSFADDYPGNLYKILKAFANRTINLTRIESRPAKQLMGKYIFYIDFLGHQQDEQVTSVLQDIAGKVSWLKVLGSYPVDASRT